ncbi:MAG: hypothetical protein AVDCRST_MAG50-2202, partial [uncultured Acidimicrobiales bacterium]
CAQPPPSLPSRPCPSAPCPTPSSTRSARTRGPPTSSSSGSAPWARPRRGCCDTSPTAWTSPRRGSTWASRRRPGAWGSATRVDATPPSPVRSPGSCSSTSPSWRARPPWPCAGRCHRSTGIRSGDSANRCKRHTSGGSRARSARPPSSRCDSAPASWPLPTSLPGSSPPRPSVSSCASGSTRRCAARRCGGSPSSKRPA